MDSPLRVGYDARYIRTDHHDGISRFSSRIAHELAALVAKQPRFELTFLISDPGQLAHLPAECSYALISSPTSARERSVARTVNKLGLDTVFSPMQTMGSRGRSYRLILTVHDLIYYRHPMPPRQFAWPVRLLWRLYHLSWWPQRWLLNASDAVVAVSNTTKALIAEHHLTRRPVYVVSNAAEPLPSVPDEPRGNSLVYMGSFMPYKNVETLIDALEYLPDYELHLLSRIHPRDRARLTERAGGKNVIFHDGVSDREYSHELARARAAVTASLDEGFGIPVIEAMAAGVPVVCSDIPIFREIGGEAAVFAPAQDAAAFARAVRDLQNPKEFSRMAALGRTQAARYSWKASAQALFDVLEEVSAKPLG
jgi:glycosyltransferase involved in cell wall biosynthesis